MQITEQKVQWEGEKTMPLVRQLIEAGVPIKRIAKDLSVHRNTLHRHLKKKAPTGDTEGATNHHEGGTKVNEPSVPPSTTNEEKE